MQIPLKLLLHTAVEADISSVIESLQHCGYALQYEQAADRQALLALLKDDADWGVVIADANTATAFDELLDILQQHQLVAPLIIISDALDEAQALAAVEAGAYDVLRRDERLRLCRAVNHALRCSEIGALRGLLMHNETVRETEREALARDIHDELGGILTAIKMDVRWLQKKNCGDDAGAQEKFALLAEQLDSAINTVRRIITDLRPSVLDELGLSAALEWQLSEFERQSGIRTTLRNQEQPVVAAEAGRTVALFRIFQGVLGAIASRGGVSRVEVELSSDSNNLQLVVDDNGAAGMGDNYNEKGHYEWFAIRERALAIGARLDVSRSTAGENRISLRMPL